MNTNMELVATLLRNVFPKDYFLMLSIQAKNLIREIGTTHIHMPQKKFYPNDGHIMRTTFTLSMAL
ncbi:hypothetical protein OAL10_02645 [Gammaproteobacteria bacterium]|nr:hypothetical protein [Gammaproteobacteria bacterium]